MNFDIHRHRRRATPVCFFALLLILLSSGAALAAPLPGHPVLSETAAAAPSLTYHGGAVMHTNTAYAVYWLPAGSVVSANYQALLTGFQQNVAAASVASAASTVYAVPTQYWTTPTAISWTARRSAAPT